MKDVRNQPIYKLGIIEELEHHGVDMLWKNLKLNLNIISQWRWKYYLLKKNLTQNPNIFWFDFKSFYPDWLFEQRMWPVEVEHSNYLCGNNAIKNISKGKQSVCILIVLKFMGILNLYKQIDLWLGELILLMVNCLMIRGSSFKVFWKGI